MESQHIDHERCAVFGRLKIVIVYQGFEGPSNHSVLKMPGRLKGGYAAGEALRDAQMACFPGDFFAQFKQA